MPLSNPPQKIQRNQINKCFWKILWQSIAIYSNTDKYLERQKGAEVVCNIVGILKRLLTLTKLVTIFVNFYQELLN